MTEQTQKMSLDKWAKEVIYSAKVDYAVMTWTEEMVKSHFKDAYDAGITPYQLLKGELGEALP